MHGDRASTNVGDRRSVTIDGRQSGIDEPCLYVDPEEAAAANISDGDPVRIVGKPTQPEFRSDRNINRRNRLIAESDVRRAIIAGWTGRSREAVEHHIEELQAIGVSPPSTVPLFYRVSTNLLTHSREIEVLGNESSGEFHRFGIHRGGVEVFGSQDRHRNKPSPPKIDRVWIAAGFDVDVDF